MGRDRGQILIIFAVSLLVIIGIAALVFDGGMMLLERRTQQNAADAAALAGARFLPDDQAAARNAARSVATANGYTHGLDRRTVTVSIPPTTGPNAGSTDHVEVKIGSSQDSLFAGIWGVTNLNVAARAVAANHTGVPGEFALLGLDPSGCDALIVEGQGELIANGDVQVNSTCTPNAMRLAGQGEIVTAPNVACKVVGGYSEGGAANENCAGPTTGEPAIPDPLASIPEPPIPTTGDPPVIVYPTAIVREAGTKAIPPGCPGSATPATHAAPALCQFAGSYSGTTWRLYPGYYPGGLLLEAGTFYLEPGIYHFAGGGVEIKGGGASATSVPVGATTLGGGVLLYNGDHPMDPDGGTLRLAGGDAGVNLWPLDDPSSPYNSLVIFQDRAVCHNVSIVGASSSMQLRGTIYVPGGSTCPANQPVLVAEGNGGTVTTDQIIAFRFQLKGSGGSLTVAYNEDFLPDNTVAGLVE
jgi:hypothetical protein